MSENVVIVGATSGIGRALSHVMAKRGCRLVLAGRKVEELERDASDVRVRYGVEVAVEPFEAVDYDGFAAFVARCRQSVGGMLHGAVICHGLYADTPQVLGDLPMLKRLIDVNFTSVAWLSECFAADFAQRPERGWLAVISSVAGDRGRQSNYAYGATKAGLSAYLQGLRNRRFRDGVHVLTIKPGPVDTPMLEGRGFENSKIVASPERVAIQIDRAIRRRRNVIYTPHLWRVIMAIIRAIPEPIFKRLRL
jgi:short-subunit dehydrogenase